jgi:hypothetical protein
MPYSAAQRHWWYLQVGVGIILWSGEGLTCSSQAALWCPCDTYLHRLPWTGGPPLCSPPPAAMEFYSPQNPHVYSLLRCQFSNTELCFMSLGCAKAGGTKAVLLRVILHRFLVGNVSDVLAASGFAEKVRGRHPGWSTSPPFATRRAHFCPHAQFLR